MVVSQFEILVVDLAPREGRGYHVPMEANDELVYWLRRELNEMRDSVQAMVDDQMQVRHRHGADWIDATPTVKPDLRERMWQLEKLLKAKGWL